MKFKPLSGGEIDALQLIAREPGHPQNREMTKTFTTDEAKAIARLLMGESDESVRADMNQFDAGHWEEITEAFHDFKKTCEGGKTESVRSIEKYRRKNTPYAC